MNMVISQLIIQKPLSCI